MSPFDTEVLFLVAAIIVAILTAILYFAGRPPRAKRARNGARASGSDVLAQLEDVLGIAVLVRSVEPGPPAQVDATLMLDSRTADVTGTGESEAEAWRDLLQAAMDWKNEDQQNIRIYGGG
jgi:hypothetical protein